MNEVIYKALCKYENLIAMGDFNIDNKSSNSDKDKLEIFCDLFNLKNLVHSKSSLHFQKTHVVETGLSEYHKMISTFFKACSSKLRTKVIYYRSYKKLRIRFFMHSQKSKFTLF